MSRTGISSAVRPLVSGQRQYLASSSRTLATAASSTSTTGSSERISPSDPVKPLPLTWPKYLSLRRQRKLWSNLTSIPSAFAGLTVGGGYFASLEADPTDLIMGMEPMIVYGGATVGCMALGYLIGPTIGSSLFSLTHPKLSKGNPAPLEVMDRAFYDHVKANRASPEFQSVNNPAPDFYGEKIVSLSTYRRWLRDQAAYTRKAMHGVPTDA